MIAEKHMRPAVVERAISGWVSNRAWGEGKIWFGAPCVWPGRRVWSTMREKRHLDTTSNAGVRKRHVRVA